ncbi:alpha-glycosidase [Acrocarpospora corrugata]|uniref:Alpha-glycosidase n=1 Tax=Acrocarpospora corrugata TaxID=35763 RepID=A0A5M3W2R3_9ACTN|nr:glycoside hydrolase family 13 protein [Acrocarpospora corrugata]GES01431.1 alpha-glycosidase [Acrocarpospora corrugata]
MKLALVPHHDGSALHVPEQRPTLGDTVPVFVRLPHGYPVDAVYLRSGYDGEPRYARAVVDRQDALEVWWRADLLVHNPDTRYRFLLDRGDYGHTWLHAGGLSDHDPADATDFRLTTFGGPPAWVDDAVIYQIFPDRFAKSGRVELPAPDWAMPAQWTDKVIDRGPQAGVQFYGGDLYGIADRLDYLVKLGVDVVYLTPFFPAASNHRYNATSFDQVDPQLGGDAALAALTAAAHRRGMRVIGDLTTNHSGDTHEWFRRAMADPSAPEASYYYLDGDGGYVAWFDVPSLPKLNWGSPELRERVLEVAGRWLRQPYGLDGWRIDVANMTGRQGAEDHYHDAARAIRGVMGQEKYLFAEHFHDYTADLPGDGWQGVMNYAGFAKPVWSWLTPYHRGPVIPGIPLPLRALPGERTAATMRAFAAGVPWSATNANVTLLSSHDSPRIRTFLGTAERVAVAAGLLFTYPGTPMMFMGDEIGLEGANGEDARIPMPWDDPVRFAEPTYDVYRELIALRRAHPALRTGGLRWLHAAPDTLLYLRESPEERLLILASRAPHTPLQLPAALARDIPHNVYGGAQTTLDGDTLTLPGDGPAFQVWSL